MLRTVAGFTFSIALSVLSIAHSVQAQIVPDQTLPSNSIAPPNCSDCEITGGTRVGGNLFHSFEQFSVSPNGSAYFNNEASIENIFSRVTGDLVSNIDGLIRANGTANLFLLNPNGIIFGPNARLNVGGSFAATTLDSLIWLNGEQFSASGPGSAESLLTIVGDPSGFIASQRQPAAITSTGNTLRVNENQSLLLLGGNITLDNSRLIVRVGEGGRIELAGVSGQGTVGLTASGNLLQLGFPNQLDRADVALLNNSFIVTAAAYGGSVAINARDLDILGRSQILAGIYPEAGSIDAQAGDVTLNATGNIRVGQLSRVDNTVNRNSTGNSGNININAGSLFVTDGSQLSTNLFGRGNAGDIRINGRDRVSFVGLGALDGETNSAASGAFSLVQIGAVGNGGNVQVTTGSLSLTNVSFLESSTLGTGNSGNVQVQARNRILISDGSAIGSQVDLETVGNGGDIDITAGSLSILSGGQIGTGIFGLGDAGSIRIRVSDRIFLNGFATIPNGEVSPSGVFSSVNQQAVGQGGNINITTASLIAANGAVVNSSTNGRGGAGDIRIIASDRISLTGQAGTTRTAIDSTIAPQAEGDGGNIQITTRSLSVSNGAGINASVSGIGDAGDIRIRASDRVSLIGEGVGGRTQPSIIRSDVEGRAIGTGGNISIDTGTLLIRNGGQLGAATFGRGNAGNVRIEADDRVLLSGSERTGYTAINTAVQTDAVGNAGSVEILTGILSVVNGAGIVVSTFGRGDGGDLRVEARDRITLNGEIRIADPSAPTGTSRAPSGLFSSVGNRYSRAAIGNTGEISITTDSLNVTDGALIATSSFGRGNAGDVNIEADRIILSGEGLSTRGSPRGILSRGEAGARGSGGDVEIEANSLSITDEAVLAASSFGRGSSGNIDASVSSIFLNNGRIEVENRSQSGGNITLRNIDTLLLRNGSGISATAGIDRAGGGDGGNITIDAENGFVVAVPQENSNITANAFSGSGGNVDLTIQGIFGIESQPAETPLSDITASSTFGVAGNVTIARPDVDPSRGLTELPADVTDASTQIAQTCATSSNVAQTQSEFVITGRGGLPDSPNDLRSSSAILTDLVTLNPFTEAESSAATVDRPAPTIVEAQGWIVGDRGEIQLVAQAPTVTPAHLASIAACNGS